MSKAERRSFVGENDLKHFRPKHEIVQSYEFQLNPKSINQLQNIKDMETIIK